MNIRLVIVALVTMTSAMACARAKRGQEDADKPCQPSRQPCAFAATLSQITLAPGDETDALCQTWTLNNPEELLVTTVEMKNDGGYHHSNWFFVPDSMYAVPDGTWGCDELGFSDFEAAVAGGFLFAQSTQSRAETQRFPAGGAVRIPPYARVIGHTHAMNMTGETLTTRMHLRLATAPPGQVTALLAPMRLEYRDLHIPPRARSEFTTECDLRAAYQNVMGRPLRYSVYYILPHYHELGAYAEVSVLGGPHDGRVLHRITGFGHNLGRALEPPADLAQLEADGLRFTCGYDNPRDEQVGWGIHGQEMCVFGIFAGTDMGVEADVVKGTGQRAGVRKDGTHLHTGPCQIQGLPWAQDRPGGPPR